MKSITIWVTQIIIFLIIATIVSLIIPNNRMKTSIQTIIGLLLLLTFSKPLLYIFTIDVDTSLKQVEELLVEDTSLANDIDYSLKKQKNEIQATQDAYILNEMERQLITEANPQMMERFGVRITAVKVYFSQDQEGVISIENFESISVYFSEDEGTENEQAIDPIIIDTKNEWKVDRTDETNELKEVLSTIWGIDQSQINLNQEGGTS